MTPGAVRLALETSSRPPSIAVAALGRTVAVQLDRERRHASDLVPALDELFASLDVRPATIGMVAVGLGPGSYTGLRVGIATALGLARATGADLVGVPSVAALAFAALAPGETGTVLFDARSGEVYLARYRRTTDGVEELSAPRVLDSRAAAGELASGDRLLGDATVADAAALDAAVRSRLETERVPDASSVLALAARRHERFGPTPRELVAPLYLRPFAAGPRRR